MKRTRKEKYLKISGDAREETVGEVAVESGINIILNGKNVGVLPALPEMFKELAIGYLLGSGVLHAISEIEDIEIDGENVNVRISASKPDFTERMELVRSSECVEGWRIKLDALNPKITADTTISIDLVQQALREMHKHSQIWKETGGTHSAALFSLNGELLAFAEDISRHNAVDKVIGFAALNEADFLRSFLVCSGRLPGEMVLKAANVGIPIVISRTAPLDSGIFVARQVGLTLVGFARGNRMNVYSMPERIK